MLWGGRRADPAPQGTVSSSVTCQIPGAPKQKDGVHSRLVRWGAQINVCTPVCRDPRTISSLFLRLCLHVILVDVVLMLMTGSLQSRLGWMTNNPPPQIYFFSPGWKITITCYHTQLFYVGIEDWTQVPTLIRPVFYQWSCFSGPFYLVLMVLAFSMHGNTQSVLFHASSPCKWFWFLHVLACWWLCVCVCEHSSGWKCSQLLPITDKPVGNILVDFQRP